MANYNKVILIGNLTRDPEVRYTSKAMAIAKLSLAVNRYWRDPNGEQKEEVTFVDVDAFGKQAETIGNYMKKGRPILVEGRLKGPDDGSNPSRSRPAPAAAAAAPAGAGAASAPAGPAPSGAGALPGGAASTEVEETPPAEDDVPF
jgi:single-strand DNA-binding protein